MIQKASAPPDNWHPLCYSPQRGGSQTGVHSDGKRHSQSEMQMEHRLCSVNKTAPKFGNQLKGRVRGWVGFAALFTTQRVKAQAAPPTGCDAREDPGSESCCGWKLSCLTGDKCRLREAETPLRLEKISRIPKSNLYQIPTLSPAQCLTTLSMRNSCWCPP